jgi:aminoglycoside N3'-acetyltransferase
MYYVIKKQDSPSKCFIGFKVPKYIASNTNNSVIFEFIVDGKTTRKWIKKHDIILLTEDKEYFLKIMQEFENVEKMQQELINEAQQKLNKSRETFTEVMHEQINQYNEIRHLEDVPCILKNL